MSSQPHTRLPWVVRRTRLPLLSMQCVDCRSESATAGEGRFRVNANGKLDIPPDWPGDEPPPVQVEVVFEDPVPVRPERLIAQGLGLSRGEILRRVKSDTPLHRPTSTGFTFTGYD